MLFKHIQITPASCPYLDALTRHAQEECSGQSDCPHESPGTEACFYGSSRHRRTEETLCLQEKNSLYLEHILRQLSAEHKSLDTVTLT